MLHGLSRDLRFVRHIYDLINLFGVLVYCHPAPASALKGNPHGRAYVPRWGAKVYRGVIPRFFQHPAEVNVFSYVPVVFMEPKLEPRVRDLRKDFSANQ